MDDMIGKIQKFAGELDELAKHTYGETIINSVEEGRLLSFADEYNEVVFILNKIGFLVGYTNSGRFELPFIAQKAEELRQVCLDSILADVCSEKDRKAYAHLYHALTEIVTNEP